MRRLAGFVALFLGVFLLVVGVLAKVYMYPRLAKAPLDQDSVTVSEAPGATIFDRSQLKVRQADLVARRTVLGDVKAAEAAKGDVAVWNVSVVIEEKTTGKMIRTVTDRVAFDRKTSVAVNCCNEDVDGNREIRHKGIEYKFPFDTKKTSYQYFDTTLGNATEMRYVATEKIGGLTVYKFEQKIDPVEISKLQIPGSLINRSESSVDVGQYYSNVRTVWVEPKTGVIVRGQEAQFSTLRDATGADVLTLTKADLAFTEKTVNEQLARAKDGRKSLSLLGSTGPIIGVILGLLLAAVGVVLLRVTEQAQAPGAHREEPARV